MLKNKIKFLSLHLISFANILKQTSKNYASPNILESSHLIPNTSKISFEKKIKIKWSSSIKKICLQPTEKTLSIRQKHKLISRNLQGISIHTVTDIYDQIFYLTDHILPFNTKLTNKQKQSFNTLYATVLASNPPIYDLRSWNDLITLAQKRIVSIRPSWYKEKLPWLSYLENVKKVVVHDEDSIGGLFCKLIESYPIPNLKPVVFLGFIGFEEAAIFRQEFARQFFLCDLNRNPVQGCVDIATPEENIFLRETSYMDFFRVTNIIRNRIEEQGFRTVSLIIPNFTNNQELGQSLKKDGFLGTPIYRFRDDEINKISCTITNPNDKKEYTMLSFNRENLIRIFKIFNEENQNKPLPNIELDSLENYLYKITNPDWRYNSMYVIPSVNLFKLNLNFY